MNHPSNLKIPYVMYISAPRGSGKSSLLINLMIQPKFYRHKFDKVYIFCPSYHLDPKYQHLMLPDDQVFTEYTNSKLEEIVESSDPKQETLIILDDCMSEADFKSNNQDNILNTLAIRGRHMHISLIISLQKTTGGSTVLRTQADGVFLFKPRSLNEIKSIYQDNSINAMSFKEFNELIARETSEPYSFIYINYQQNKVYDKNFNCIL